MTEVPEPRSAEQRKRDTLARLEDDIDCWVATADGEANAYLVPLSYAWDGATLTLATAAKAPTGRNLAVAPRVRLSLDRTRDVVMIDGTVEVFTHESVPTEMGDAFAARHWDARLETTPYLFFRITPQTIQAWREENELRGRTIMRDGVWLI